MSKEYLSGQVVIIEVMEKLLFNAGYLKQTKDGGRTGHIKQIKEQDTGSLRFTRKYNVYINGENTHTDITFVYDKRNDWADMEISSYGLINLKLKHLIGGLKNEGIQMANTEGNQTLCTQNEGIRS